MRLQRLRRLKHGLSPGGWRLHFTCCSYHTYPAPPRGPRRKPLAARAEIWTIAHADPRDRIWCITSNATIVFNKWLIDDAKFSEFMVVAHARQATRY